MSKALLAVVLCVIIVTAVVLALVATLPRITVTLGTPTPCGTACWDIVVTSVSAPEPLKRFSVILANERETGQGSPVSAPLAPGFIFGPEGISLFFTDVGLANHLDSGDAFRLENSGYPGTCTLGLSSFRASASVRWAC